MRRKGEVVHEVARLPLQDSIPIDFDATRTGPRSIDWRSDKPRMLTWAEAQDKGDPKKFPKCSPRDIVFGLDFQTPDCAVSKIAQTDLRCSPCLPVCGRVACALGFAHVCLPFRLAPLTPNTWGIWIRRVVVECRLAVEPLAFCLAEPPSAPTG